MNHGADLRDERGMGLIEVMVSALILVIVAGAVLNGIDGATATSAQTQANSVAANLAQQDQERMQSLRTAALSNYTNTRTVSVGGAAYTVDSTAQYVTDGTQQPTCSSTSDPDYIRITSTVKSANMKVPLSLNSIVDPTVGAFTGNTGSLALTVLNAAGTGVSGLRVNINGPASYSQTTATNGCAFFGFVPVGTYTVTYSQAGYVDKSGTQNVSFTAGVAVDQTLQQQTTYDRAATVPVVLETRVGGVARSSNWTSVQMSNAGVPAGTATYLVPDTVTPANTITPTTIFPFTTSYSNIASGVCMGNTLPAALVSALPAGTYTTTKTFVGGTNPAIKVFQPALPVLVKFNGNAVAGAAVKFTQTASGCTGSITRTTNSTGQLDDPGLPYGTWTVCAQAQVNGKSYTSISSSATGQINNDANGNNTVNLSISDAGSVKTCP